MEKIIITATLTKEEEEGTEVKTLLLEENKGDKNFLERSILTRPCKTKEDMEKIKGFLKELDGEAREIST